MDVDESGRDEEPIGVDGLVRVRGIDASDLDDAPAVDRDVGGARCRAAPVDHRAALDQEIERHREYISLALRPNRRARASVSMPSVYSRNSSTTPGYFASLCGKSDAHTNRSLPASGHSNGAVVSPGSKLIQHWRWKYSFGVSESS